jgi:hypothetical protein
MAPKPIAATIASGYEVPFRFTGKLNKLSIEVRRGCRRQTK